MNSVRKQLKSDVTVDVLQTSKHVLTKTENIDYEDNDSISSSPAEKRYFINKFTRHRKKNVGDEAACPKKLTNNLKKMKALTYSLRRLYKKLNQENHDCYYCIFKISLITC